MKLSLPILMFSLLLLFGCGQSSGPDQQDGTQQTFSKNGQPVLDSFSSENLPYRNDQRGSQTASEGQPTMPTMARKVLQKLFSVYGQRQRACPKLLILADNSYPRYRQSANEIVLDQRCLEVCRSFGKDSLDALAFIIGHELAHFFQEETSSSPIEFSYLAYDKNKDSSPEKERLADVQGIFNAYLADFRTIAILPDLISKIYKTYQLSDRMEAYPTLGERRRAVIQVLATVDTLTQLYEAANYLAALGQYELATACYQYILKYYPGREIYNNLGVNYARHAMNCSEKSPDIFLFPLEIDTQSRLKKQRPRGGEAGLSEAERALRKQLLEQAARFLEQALKMDPAYFPAQLNLVCVLTLQGKAAEAVDFAKTHRFLTNTRLSENEKSTARLALGIALATTGTPSGEEQAGQFFEDLVTSKIQPSLAFMAAHNLKAQQENLQKKPLPPPTYNCQMPFELFKVDSISIWSGRSATPTFRLPGNTALEVAFQKLPTSSLLQFSRSGKSVFHFQRMPNAAGKRGVAAPSFEGIHPQLVQTATGFFLVCEEDHAVFLFDPKGRLVEWGRFYDF